MRKTCLNMVYELAKQDERVVFIGSDLGPGTLQEFKEELPDQFIMEGISEANIIGMAAGLALDGRVVYVNTIAPFLVRRAYEQIVIDLALHNANVRFIGNGGGMVYAPLGPTHQTIEDFASLRAIPNMTILSPADASEMERLMPLTLRHQGPVYIRLGKGGDPIVSPQDVSYEIGGAVSAFEKGNDAVLFCTGVALQPTLKAAENLAEQNINVKVLHLPTVKPLDEQVIIDTMALSPVIVTVEEHNILGGLGGSMAELLAEANFDQVKKFRRIGISDQFADQYGSQAGLMQRFGIEENNISATVLDMLQSVKQGKDRILV